MRVDSITTCECLHDHEEKSVSIRGISHLELRNSWEPLYVLLCCWLAAIGAGLLKTEEILEGVARLRISNDIEFEEETFIAMMDEARERRAKQKGAPPVVPMEVRVEKALDAIYVCCFGKDPIEEEDERILRTILGAVFPSVQKQEIRRIVEDMVEKVEDGGMDYIPDAKPLSKEAVEIQMKDLNFLKQNSDT
ncbi:calcium homeostasis regulator CHoR1 [Trifolium pratense]|uniref:Calcium homeostasis regulator CHoR1 n=1 Tax=Trifolium pratense TaxID=57577 RepID=A0A2K3PQ09_TRIPR|nr:calcium homeostasis regulator CHoR1 [Trifolium pratense]